MLNLYHYPYICYPELLENLLLQCLKTLNFSIAFIIIKLLYGFRNWE